MTEKKENQKNTDVAKHEPSQSERFSAMVQREFSGKAGEVIRLTGFQKRLIQNYFIAIDIALKTAEEKRLKKDEKYRDKVAIIWHNVNMELLAVNVVACARIGYDPALPNHIYMIPYKNNNTDKYDIVFTEGYRGKELKAKKYGLNVPDEVVVEVVYSTDTFKPVKKDLNNRTETYVFEINKPFARGEIVGGFYYLQFKEEPWRNRLMQYSIAEIEKRKPAYASVEFWGGEKDIWENGKKTGKKEKVEGWYHEMVYKTLYRAAYGSITIDSQKIDEDFMKLLEHEQLMSSRITEQEIDENANREQLDFIEAEDVTPQPEKQTEAEPQKKADIKAKEPELTGPGF